MPATALRSLAPPVAYRRTDPDALHFIAGAVFFVAGVQPVYLHDDVRGRWLLLVAQTAAEVDAMGAVFSERGMSTDGVMTIGDARAVLDTWPLLHLGEGITFAARPVFEGGQLFYVAIDL